MSNFRPKGQRDWSAEFGVPSGRGFIALLQAFRATGGTAPGEIVGRLLEEHQVGNSASLVKLIDAGQAFGFEWRDSLWIPMFQFDVNDLALNTSVQNVREKLPSLWSGWMLASWFAGPNVRLDGSSPAHMLDLDLGAVIRAARSVDSLEELSCSPRQRAYEVTVPL